MRAILTVRLVKCCSSYCVVDACGCVFGNVYNAIRGAVAYLLGIDPEYYHPGEYGRLSDNTVIVKTYDIEPNVKLQCINKRIDVPRPSLNLAVLALVSLGKRLRNAF